MSSKSVSQEWCPIVSSKSVLPECEISISCQGVPQLFPVENVTSIAFLPQRTCQHSGSWASSCFAQTTKFVQIALSQPTENCTANLICGGLNLEPLWRTASGFQYSLQKATIKWQSGCMTHISSLNICQLLAAPSDF